MVLESVVLDRETDLSQEGRGLVAFEDGIYYGFVQLGEGERLKVALHGIRDRELAARAVRCLQAGKRQRIGTADFPEKL